MGLGHKLLAVFFCMYKCTHVAESHGINLYCYTVIAIDVLHISATHGLGFQLYHCCTEECREQTSQSNTVSPQHHASKHKSYGQEQVVVGLLAPWCRGCSLLDSHGLELNDVICRLSRHGGISW